ncbi:MAG: hypothetical protein LBO65_08560 [Spirochaetaceae bacterium]|jgi:hypothetical protein|nr:hypothetical protein [Spirochaetaceae bacterium]
MKRRSRIFFALCILLPALAHSQNLQPWDIEIFIAHFDTLDDVLSFHGFDENAAWSRYRKTTLVLKDSLTHLFYTGAKFSDFQNRYMDLLNCTPPVELEQAFQTMGWNNNGNKKFWTILMGGTFWVIRESFLSDADFAKNMFGSGSQEYDYERILQTIDKILGLFDEQDLYLVSSSPAKEFFMAALFPLR